MNPWEEYQDTEQGPWSEYGQTQGQTQTKPQETILQMLARNLGAAGQETLEAAKNVGNQATLGIAGQLYKMASGGQEWVNKSKMSPMTKTGSDVLGMALPTAGIAKGIVGLGKATTVPQKMVQAATVGGATGFALPPETSFSDLQARGQQAILGALVGLAGERITAGLDKIFNPNTTVKQAEEAGLMRWFRQRFVGTKQSAVSKFGDDIQRLSLENPDRKVGIRAEVAEIDNPGEGWTDEAINIAKKVPHLKKFINNPNLTEEVTLREVQDMVNYIDNKIPSTVKQEHWELIDFRNSLKARQLDAFPEMASVREEYAKVMTPYNQIKNQFKFNRVQNAIKNGFGGSEGETAMRELFKDQPDVIKSVDKYRTAVKVANAGKDILWKLLQLGAVGAGAGAGVGIAKKVLE